MTDARSNHARRLFRSAGNPVRNVHLDWLDRFTPAAMAKAFKEAADATIERSETDTRHPDRYFYPVAYLFRHYLELQLKNIIDDGQRLHPRPITKTNAAGHRLIDLWNDAVAVFDIVFPGDDSAALAEAGAIIREMDIADPDGQSFRYYRNRKGAVNLEQLPRVISLRELQRDMNVLFAFLSGCAAGVENAAEWCDEAQSERSDNGY